MINECKDIVYRLEAPLLILSSRNNLGHPKARDLSGITTHACRQFTFTSIYFILQSY